MKDHFLHNFPFHSSSTKNIWNKKLRYSIVLYCRQKVLKYVEDRIQNLLFNQLGLDFSPALMGEKHNKKLKNEISVHFFHIILP